MTLEFLPFHPSEGRLTMRIILSAFRALAAQPARRFNQYGGGGGLTSIIRTLSSSLPSQRPIRWGILSAGKISSDYVQAISTTPHATAVAVAARSPRRAAEFAARHHIPAAYGSYDELLADPAVDVVYVGSIANEHEQLARKSILAGIPTVVEKPLTTGLRQTLGLVDLARRNNVFLMEGMWTRCFPAMQKVRSLIATNAIGRPSVVQGDFGWSTEECSYPDDRIWDPSSGGMTLDISMYMAQIGQVAFPGGKVEEVQAMGTTKYGVDHTVCANVMYNSSSSAAENYDQKGMLQFYITGDANSEERVLIQGTKGRIVMDPPAHVPTTIRLCTDEGRGMVREEVFEHPLPDDSFASKWNYPGSVGFTYQIAEVGKALRAGRKECHHFTLSDSLQVAAIMDEILDQVHGNGAAANYADFGQDTG